MFNKATSQYYKFAKCVRVVILTASIFWFYIVIGMALEPESQPISDLQELLVVILAILCIACVIDWLFVPAFNPTSSNKSIEGCIRVEVIKETSQENLLGLQDVDIQIKPHAQQSDSPSDAHILELYLGAYVCITGFITLFLSSIFYLPISAIVSGLILLLGIVFLSVAGARM